MAEGFFAPAPGRSKGHWLLTEKGERALEEYRERQRHLRGHATGAASGRVAYVVWDDDERREAGTFASLADAVDFVQRVVGFRPYAGEIKKRQVGSMISMASGKALGYSLWFLQDRGQLYIKPATEVYEGMVIGNTAKGEEMTVNPTKAKAQSNVRSSSMDEAIVLVPIFDLTIERGMEIMGDDEYLEITPLSVRLRKQYLTENDRAKARR